MNSADDSHTSHTKFRQLRSSNFGVATCRLHSWRTTVLASVYLRSLRRCDQLSRVCFVTIRQMATLLCRAGYTIGFSSILRAVGPSDGQSLVCCVMQIVESLLLCESCQHANFSCQLRCKYPGNLLLSFDVPGGLYVLPMLL